MFRKNLHKMTYHVRGSMAFGPRNGCYVLNCGIVCDTVPILCMHIYIGMENNVAGGSFPFRRTEKPFCIFRAQKTGRFMKQPPKCYFRMLPSHFYKILDHLTWTISQLGDFKSFCSSQVKRTNVYRIGRKWVLFVLLVHDLTPVIF